jgi:Amino acid transporters
VGIVAFGSVIAHTAVLLIFQLGQPRIFFSMSRDGLLPRTFSHVHKKFRTPHKATILTGVFVALFAAFASIDEMVDLTNIGTLFAFILVCSGIIVLRKKDPGRPRPFKVPGGWLWSGIMYAAVALVVILFVPASVPAKILLLAAAATVFALARNIIFPLLGVLSCLYLIFYLPPTSWLRFAAWLNFGFVIYVAYGAIHSRLMAADMKKHSPEHEAFTARVGIILLVMGNALLFLTRAFDLFRAAYVKLADPAGWSRISAALAQMLHSGQWTEVSLFLVIPLALNTLVLCPLIIRRAAKAGGFSKKDKKSRAAGNAAIVIAVLSLIYLAIVLF